MVDVSVPGLAIGADYVARLQQQTGTRSQLASALAVMPSGTGALDILAGVSQQGGTWAQAEASWHFSRSAAVVANAGWAQTTGFGASAGVRWKW